MKKIFIYFFAFLFICFIFPALLTKREKETSSEVNNIEINDTSKVEENAQSQYEYKKYGTIKLLHQKTGEVEEVNLDTYLCNVVSAEMPADYEKEALKAQAVVARTYTIYKIENKKHDNADICDSSTCCQAWVSKETRLERWEESKREENWNKIEQCVNETKGKIVTYDGKPINAFFHANSGGTTELPVNVWGGSGLPYLQVVQTAGEEGYTQYNSEVILGEDELINKLKELGLNMKYLGKKKVLDENFAGKRFVLTGTLKELTRDVAKEYIVTRGGKCIESVSSKTDVVIVGENPGSKYDKAKLLGIPIWSEQDFLDKLRKENE